jgi:hypothetical protein
MRTKVVLHIGTHKTGTTSLQHFLLDSQTLLARAGAWYPPGFVIDTAHSELPLLSVRLERDWPARLRFPELRMTGWLDAAAKHVRALISDAPCETVVFSHEDLSYLRFDDEFERLTRLLEPADVRVIVFLRDRDSFLRSYGDQLRATGFVESTDTTSFAYLGADSWLVDYDALLDGYRRAFGASNVEVYDYNAVMRRDGSIIPAFSELLGVSRAELPPLDGYRFNQAGMHLRPTAEQLDAIRRRLADQAT